jgi:hypothetical protein
LRRTSEGPGNNSTNMYGTPLESTAQRTMDCYSPNQGTFSRQSKRVSSLEAIMLVRAQVRSIGPDSMRR